METDLKIDVATLDAPHRQALEEVIGCGLAPNQRLIISVVELMSPRTPESRPAQSLDDWTSVYNGLSDCEIHDVEEIANTRANLTRHLPQ